MPGFDRRQGVPAGAKGQVLAVTDEVLLAGAATGHDPDRGRHVYGFSGLDSDLLARIKPGLVVAPLVARSFDATDLVLRLAALGYRGRVVLIADAAPDPVLLAEELQALAPDLGIEVLGLPKR